MKSSTHIWGAVCGALAAAAYGLNPLFAKPLYELGFSPPVVLFYRFFLAAVMLVPLLMLKRYKFALTRSELIASLFGAVLMVCSSLCLYNSFNYMDVGLAMTLLFLYPVVVALIMTAVYREKISWSIALSIALALGGLCCVTMPGKGAAGGVHITWLGVILAIGSAVSYAVYIVAVRKSSMSKLPSEKLTFYTVLFGSPFFILFMQGNAMFKLPSEPMSWLLLLGVAFFPTIIALVFMALAIEKIGATPTAILGVLEPLTGLLIGIIVYGEKLTLFSALGVVLIFASVVLVIVGDRKKLDT